MVKLQTVPFNIGFRVFYMLHYFLNIMIYIIVTVYGMLVTLT